jgi:prostaglandin reductase 3
LPPTTYRKLIRAHDIPRFPDSVDIVAADLPDPAPGDVLVRNQVVGINAADRMVAIGQYITPSPPPFDMGAESAGEIVAVGSNVTHLKPGDCVMGFGGFKEYFTLDARFAVPIPQATAEIVSLAVGGLTASIALEVVGGLKSGDTVLVTAAAGGTGHFAVQLAKLAGCHVIGTCGSDEKAAMLRALGCDRPINYRTENLRDVLKAEYSKGIDIVFESVGGELFDICLNRLAVRGRLIVIGMISEYESGPQRIDSVRVSHKLLPKSASIHGFWLMHYYRQYAAEHTARLVNLLQAGKLKPEIDPTEFRGIESIISAIEYLYSGQSQGKVVVHF